MPQPNLTFGPYAFDPGNRVLRRAGVELPLPPRVLGVLEVLLSRRGATVTRQELMSSVWKDAFVTDTSLAEAVSALRQVLGDDPQSPTYVQTLHRRGYRFVAPVVEASLDGVGSAVRTAPPQTGDPGSAPSIGGHLLPWTAAAICAVVAAAAIWQAASGRPAEEPAVSRFVIPLAPGSRLDPRAPALAMSSDGNTIAWSACDASGCRLFTRRIDRLEPEAVPGSDQASFPFFSPDGRSLGFFADGKLKRVSLGGAAPTVLADAPDPRGAVWTRQRRIVFTSSATAGLFEIPEDGGEPTQATVPRVRDGEVAHAWPALTPTGDVLLFTILTSPTGTRGYLAAQAVNALRTGDARRTLTPGGTVPGAATTDTVVFSRGNELLAAWFDRQQLTIADRAPVVVATVSPAAATAHFAVSASGALIIGGNSEASAPELSWMTGTHTERVAAFDRPLNTAALSADGKRLAGTDETDGTRADIWIADLSRGVTIRATHGGQNASPVWSGGTLFYAARDGGPYDIWRKDADSPARAVRIHASSTHSFPVAATPDGSALAFLRRDEATRSDLWLLPLDGRPPAPLVQTPFEEGAAAFSPDGAFIAYQSSEAGRWDVYVQRRADGKRAVISRSAATRPAWAADGSAVYYQSGTDVLRATVDGRDFRIGSPEVVTTIGGADFLGLDARGRLLVKRLPAQPDHVVLTLHWIRDLRDVLGPRGGLVPR